MHVTGITGTNGKTTTAWLAANALVALGERAGYMGTLGYGIGTELETSALTTPGCIAVHRRLRKLADAGAKSVVVEVSSHGLDQGRIDGVNLQTAAFTNLSRDHLDYHASLDAYQKAKAKLFDVAGIESAVINIGDPFGAALARNPAGTYRLITVAIAGTAPGDQPAALTAELLEARPDGLRVRFAGDYGSAEINSPLWGQFNVENLLVAAGILIASGYALDAAVKALETTPAPPGRMQVVRGAETAPLVVVDFAHTPDALAKVLLALRAHCDGQVFAVFGCGGNRDAGKRSEMGAIAALHADRVIVTDDNPRDEDPAEIVNAILTGIPADAAVEVVHDRALAIEHAINAATAADAVLIAGKGSECFQYINGNRQPFSDVDVAARAMGVAV
jgi:UDP-N-acetylmuramoyl-L-alanyl-D-glutamate--2,6-diaminopimelate ligase